MIFQKIYSGIRGTPPGLSTPTTRVLTFCNFVVSLVLPLEVVRDR
jgi:hypothetical protein